jgi:hypothetical protein
VQIDLLRAPLRGNPAYELVFFDRLSAGQRGVLAGLVGDAELYGVLQAREGAALPVQSLSCDTALLFLTLTRPAPAPAYFQRKLGARAAEVLLQLVVEGILEVEVGERFVSGAAAHALLFDSEAIAEEDGPLARLSLAALRYAAALDVDDAHRLSARLYRYNSDPLSPRRRRELPDAEAVASHLGLNRGPLATVLDRSWVPVAPSGDAADWRVWRPRRLRASGRGADPRGAGSARVVYKLYLSPAWQAMREAFAAAIGALGESRPFQIKMGRSLSGLLRPDKFVAYFSSFEDLGEAAERLRATLHGCAAQGVPFTGGIGEDALLSWGLDPPTREQAPWHERESWRLWVTHRLASALLSARGVENADPVRFALDRLSLEGFDAHTFTPSHRIWCEAPHLE